ncbi:MAG: hypothetical protein TYPL_0960 [Candidatus Tyloplasma litorale]|nr:MAG: hypothetical protein TYPL_0960 [Mycoplasmatales bacterium]
MFIIPIKDTESNASLELILVPGIVIIIPNLNKRTKAIIIKSLFAIFQLVKIDLNIRIYK